MSSIEYKSIGVVVGPEKPAAMAVVRDLAQWCKNRGIELLAHGEAAAFAGCSPLTDHKGDLAAAIDLIVVLGGDGTMLGAARLVGANEVPVLGVNFGWLGYLTEFTLNELYEALDDILEGKLVKEERMLLDVSLEREGKRLFTHLALNDAVINKTAPARMVEIECRINGLFVNSFRADGMIIATPTGSTAYSLSAGGPVVHPSLSAILLTPICPHMLSNRPVVVPGESVVELVFLRGGSGLMLTVDGQLGEHLEQNDRITMRRSDTKFEIVRPVNRDYFEVLRTKLKWGT